MRKALILLLLVLHMPAWGSLVVGLRSDNLVSWNVWERKGFTLRHYLLLYNKGQQGIDVKIKLKRYSTDGSHFKEIETNQTFHHISLAVRQLVRVEYPKKLLASDLTEYFENDESIGILSASTDKPTKVLLDASYRYYSDQGINSGQLGYWLALESITAPTRRVVLIAAHKASSASEIPKDEYLLIKTYPGFAGTYPQPGTLDSLATRGADASIVRLDKAHPSAEIPVSANLPTSGFSVFAIYVERVADAHYLDKVKCLVPHKSFGGSVRFIPVFPEQPGKDRRR